MKFEQLVEKGDKLKEWYDAGVRQVILVWDDDHKEKRRIGKGTTGIIIMDRRSRRWGNSIMHFTYLKDVMPMPDSKVTPQQKWAKQIGKIIEMLEKSGLWPEMLANWKLAEQIGYDKLKAAYDASWSEPREERIEKVKAIDSRLIEKNEKGEEYYNTEILWYMINLKVKKMKFEKSAEYNQAKLSEIKNALSKKEKLVLEGDNGYDVSFEYNPERNQAWYSEEYRGCGNGHYYLALGAEHAVFYEDD